jgi:hypothetical protein
MKKIYFVIIGLLLFKLFEQLYISGTSLVELFYKDHGNLFSLWILLCIIMIFSITIVLSFLYLLIKKNQYNYLYAIVIFATYVLLKIPTLLINNYISKYDYNHIRYLEYYVAQMAFWEYFNYIFLITALIYLFIKKSKLRTSN